MEAIELQVGQIILLTIKRIGINGEGIGYYKRKAVFVDDAIPGEVVEVEITSIREQYAYGTIKKFKTISDMRTKADCPYFGRCGGCSMQHINYKAQLLFKEDIVKEAFLRYYDGDINKLTVKPIIGMDSPWQYRNKAQLPVRHNGEKVVVGMYAKGSNRLVYTDQCIVETPIVSNTIRQVLNMLTMANIDVYNPKFQQGDLRYLIVRGFEETNEVQVTFVLFQYNKKILDVFKGVLAIPNVKSVHYSINSDPKSIEIINQEVHHIAGVKEIQGKLGDLIFSISPEAFFQLNTVQSIALYNEVKKAASFTGTEKVLDGYCGIGSIGLYVAKDVKEVIGIDSNESGIENAKRFAFLNNITNATFMAGHVIQQIQKLTEKNYKPDVVIVDPPRKGLDIQMIRYLQKARVKKIVYVSCNPSTLAKNLSHLQREYIIRYIQPIDMFPQTANVECVTLLERR